MTSYRTAVPADLPQLVGLLELLFSQEADFQPDRVRQERGLELILGSPQVGQIFVAEEAGQVIGMVSLLNTISTAEGGPVCWLEDMVIQPQSQGRGIGKRLLDFAVDAAIQQGFLRITLLTDRSNVKGQEFYSRAGFLPSEMIVLRRSLTSPKRLS
ncbi:MAG: GNAT family N-acetyltransferase [Planctomyces sp.]|nr:GNAT family N-acetyltransferase [Planctomyces sp.]